MAVSLIILFAVIIVLVNKKAYKKIDELESCNMEWTVVAAVAVAFIYSAYEINNHPTSEK